MQQNLKQIESKECLYLNTFSCEESAKLRAMSAIRAYVFCVLSCFACACVPTCFACLQNLRDLRALRYRYLENIDYESTELTAT